MSAVDLAAEHLLCWMEEACELLDCRLPHCDLYDELIDDAYDLTERFAKWCKTEYWTPENVGMLRDVCRFVERELAEYADANVIDEHTPQWFLDTTHALHVFQKRVEEGSHYFD